MNTIQEEQFIAFIGNFVYWIQQDGMPYDYAEKAACMCASCLLTTIFHILPDAQSESIAEFCREVIASALQEFYGAKQASRVPLQA